jgi:phosphatidylserine/phosphatidylglycerophosphate/cardiolipin synthase-like enzyme
LSKTVLLAWACLLSTHLSHSASVPWVGETTVSRVVTASSPDNTFQVLSSLIDSAKQAIKTSVYQLDNAALGEAFDRALKRGVKVTILVEGAPIPKVPMAELYIAKQLTKHGAKVYFYHIENGRANRTYKYFHNKYTIIDDKRVMVGSANYGMGGHSVSTTVGNREWAVVLSDPKAAKFYSAAFAHDLALEGEWVEYGALDRYKFDDPDFEPDFDGPEGSYELALEPTEDFDVPVRTAFAPDNSLAKNGPILGPLAKASRTIDVEQLRIETYWGLKSYNQDAEASPILDALLAAARRGAAVRVLLNDDRIFHEKRLSLLMDFAPNGVPHSFFQILFGEMTSALLGEESKAPRDNEATVNYLRKTAKEENLKISARLIDYRSCSLRVLHNKGMIIDKEVTLVGSLNWGESALKFNREAGVLMKSSKLAQYYEQAFDYDWKCSAH